MVKKLFVVLVATAALAVPLAGGAAAAPARGHGQAGCTLSNGAHYKTPAAMLRALAARDGSVQNTVRLYGFGSVGALIENQCG